MNPPPPIFRRISIAGESLIAPVAYRRPPFLQVFVDEAFMDTVAALQRLVDAARASQIEPPAMMQPEEADNLRVCLPVRESCLGLVALSVFLENRNTPRLESVTAVFETSAVEAQTSYKESENFNHFLAANSKFVWVEAHDKNGVVAWSTQDLRPCVEQAALEYQKAVDQFEQFQVEAQAEARVKGLNVTPTEILQLVDGVKALQAACEYFTLPPTSPEAPDRRVRTALQVKLALSPLARFIGGEAENVEPKE